MHTHTEWHWYKEMSDIYRYASSQGLWLIYQMFPLQNDMAM